MYKHSQEIIEHVTYNMYYKVHANAAACKGGLFDRETPKNDKYQSF